MAPPGEVVLQITFGPSKTPLSSSAVSYAKEHSEHATEVSAGVWRASFRLSVDERTYGEASRLLGVVSGWRSTAVEVDGSPEPAWVVQQIWRLPDSRRL